MRFLRVVVHQETPPAKEAATCVVKDETKEEGGEREGDKMSFLQKLFNDTLLLAAISRPPRSPQRRRRRRRRRRR